MIGIAVLLFGIFSIGSETELTETVVALVIGLVFSAGGVFSFLKGGKRYLDFNKDTNELRIKNQRPRNKNEEIYDLTKLSKLVINHTFERSNNSRSGRGRGTGTSSPRKVYYFTLQFSDGNIIDLGKTSKGTLSQMKDAVSGSALPAHIQRIVDFTGVEVEHINHSSGISGMMGTFMGGR